MAINRILVACGGWLRFPAPIFILLCTVPRNFSKSLRKNYGAGWKKLNFISLEQSLWGLFLRGQGKNLLSAFVDAAFATEAGAQSRIGWFCLFLGNLVSWGSEVPSRVLTSSTEAECRGLSQFVKENKWQRELQLS